MSDVSTLLDNYWSWLKDNTHVRSIEDWYEITTPYLDRHNDFVQLYAKQDGGRFVLTDDSYTLSDLEFSGCKIDSPKRQKLLETTLNGFGVALNGKALETTATAQTFALKKHSLVQAILAVNDMFYLARPHVRSLFVEDVEHWLDVHEIRYSPQIKLAGKSGFDHLFEFLIPKSKTQPERLLRTVNHPDRDTAQGLIMSWIDTRETRPVNARAIALLNDQESAVSQSVREALSNYSIDAVLWSERESRLDEFVA